MSSLGCKKSATNQQLPAGAIAGDLRFLFAKPSAIYFVRYIHACISVFFASSMNVLCPGKRPYYKRVALPVTTYVDAKKIVLGYNFLYLCTWIISIIYFVFYTKGWSVPTNISSSTTMWLESPKYPRKERKPVDGPPLFVLGIHLEFYWSAPTPEHCRSPVRECLSAW